MIRLKTPIVYSVLIVLAVILAALIFFVSGKFYRPHSSAPPAKTGLSATSPSLLENKASAENVKAPAESANDFETFLAARKKLPQESAEVSLIAVGDIMLSRSVATQIKKQNDTSYPFRKISAFLQGADMVFGNLESPITSGPEILPGEMVFHADPGVQTALKDAGFNILSLANNHLPNFGQKGIKDTLNYLDEAGIAHAGAGADAVRADEPAFLTSQGLKFAFLAYNDSDVVPPSYGAGVNHYGTNLMNIPAMIKAVKAAKSQADIVIVSMHSGVEYAPQPDASQIAFAQAAIDAGADLVIGHHPHVVQTMEKYHGHYIFYSLGNFVFDQIWPDTREGLALKIYFDKSGVTNISFWPLAIKNFQPQLLSGPAAADLLKRLDYSLATSTAWSWNKQAQAFTTSTISTLSAASSTPSNLIKSETADLDRDGVPETYSLNDGALSISEQSKIIWQSPSSWWVDDFALADSNNDGILDLNMSVWKSGDYGSEKPFWVKQNDPSVKNHFFIFDLKKGILQAIWQSSNLEVPNCAFTIADLKGDHKNELLVLEGNYNDWPNCYGQAVAVWSWNGWGFSNDWRSSPGAIDVNLKMSYILN